MTDLGYAWDVVLDGTGYQLDKSSGQDKHESISMLRAQSDTSGRPGEESLNPAGLWRRAQESWHHGAGQDWLDRADSDPYRFRTSKGVDPWDKWGLSLLPDTESTHTVTHSNAYLAVASDAIYLADGDVVNRSTDGTTWAACTGVPGGDVRGMCSDGTTVYASFGDPDDGIWLAAGSVFTQYVTNGNFGVVAYVKGRLMAAGFSSAMYNITATGAAPTALYTHPNASWAWTAFGEGPAHIYASGFASDKSAIYKTAIEADGTALEIPTHAASLPDGEIARSLTGYLGFLVIGTDLGVRFAAPDADGNLTLGELIPTTSPVLCAEGQGRFVWYGLTDYDANSTGLGRLDLEAFTADLTPAYATDLMAAAQGDVVSVVTFKGSRYFTVDTDGVYRETTGLVASGTFSTGQITYGLSDPKTVLSGRLLHDPIDGNSLELLLSTDQATSVSLGTSDTDGDVVFDATDTLPSVGRTFEASVTLAATGATNPDLHRLTLFADPDPDRTEFITVPIALADVVDDPDAAAERPQDVDAAWGALHDLFTSREVVTYERRGRTWQVVVDDFQTVWANASGRPVGTQGTTVLTLKVVGV